MIKSKPKNVPQKDLPNSPDIDTSSKWEKKLGIKISHTQGINLLFLLVILYAMFQVYTLSRSADEENEKASFYRKVVTEESVAPNGTIRKITEETRFRTE